MLILILNYVKKLIYYQPKNEKNVILTIYFVYANI